MLCIVFFIRCGLRNVHSSVFTRSRKLVGETRPGGYEFINPLLECEMPQDAVEGKDLRSLKQKIRAFVDEKKKQPGIVEYPYITVI